MRDLAFSLVGFTALAAALGSTGCRSAVNDFYNPHVSASSGGSGGSETTGTGGSAGSSILPLECRGEPSTDPKIVNDDCGAFVDLANTDQPDRSAEIPGIAVPTLVLRSNRVDGQHFARDIPGSREVVLTGVGHLMPAEAPEAVSDAILQFTHDLGDA